MGHATYIRCLYLGFNIRFWPESLLLNVALRKPLLSSIQRARDTVAITDKALIASRN